MRVPYDFVSIRLSKMIKNPLSEDERISLPNPCRSLITASGNAYSANGFKPCAVSFAAFALNTGSSGDENGTEQR